MQDQRKVLLLQSQRGSDCNFCVLLTHHFHVSISGLAAGVLYHYDELHPGIGGIAITGAMNGQGIHMYSVRYGKTANNLH